MFLPEKIGQYTTTSQLVEPSIDKYQDILRKTRSTITSTELFELFVSLLSSNENFNNFSNFIIKKGVLKQNPGYILNFNVLINEGKGFITFNPNTFSNQISTAKLTLSTSNPQNDAYLNKAYLNFTNAKLLEQLKAKEVEQQKYKILQTQLSIEDRIKVLTQKIELKIEQINFKLKSKQNSEKMLS